MKRLMTFIACLVTCILMIANPVTADQARQKAGEFLNKRSRTRTMAPISNELKMVSVGKDDSYYMFNVGEGDGFVIVSGDDATAEILGYSDKGAVDPDNMPPAMEAWMNSYSNHINYLRKSGIKATTRSSFSKTFQLQSRLARYNQEEPYYNKCPQIDNGFMGFGKRNSATGCAATAMVQLMYYHVWPSEVIRDIPGYTSKSNGFLVEPVSKGAPLKWVNTLETYNYQNANIFFPKPTEEQKEAIANIMLYAGTSIQMDYGYDSEASAAAIPYAMQQYFGYQEGARYYSQSLFELDDWLSAIYNELTENGPVIYRAAAEDESAHIFICEGIDHDMIYLNWGWDGINNAWFHVMPEAEEEKAIMKYYLNQGAVFGLKPDKGRAFNEAKQRVTIWAAGLSDNKTSWNRKSLNSDFESISLVSYINNYIPLSINFDFGIALFKGEEIVGSPDLSFRFSGATPLDKPTKVTYSYSIGKDIPDGTYTLYFVSRKVGSEEIYKADGAEGLGVTVLIKNNVLTFVDQAGPVEDNLSVGDTFIAETKEGVDVLYKVLSKSPMQVEVSCTKDDNACIDRATQGSVTIPNNVNGYVVVGVGPSAFSRCKGITKVTLPYSVTYLGNSAFASCDALESIDGIDAVESMGRLSISYCKSLKSIELPNTLTFIGAQALRNNPKLTSIFIPKNVSEIEDNFVLAGDNGLTSIQVDPENEYYNSADDCNAIIETATNKLISGCSTTRIPNTVTVLGDGAFCELTSLEEITIPASLKEFGYLAFEGCKNLKRIYCLSTKPCSFSTDAFTCFSGDEDYIYNNATLYIPDGTKSIYESTSCWNKFIKKLESREVKSYKRGDVNRDGVTNIVDIVKTINLLNDGEYDAAADLDGDQKITLSDINAIVPVVQSQQIPYSEDAVDLGLSVKWAKMNVGAVSPEDYGGYYSWAETQEKSSYSWSNYKYSDATGNSITKYCLSSSYGTVDGLTTIEPMDDAARVNMGKYWRIPTELEMDELLERCDWKLETLNGVNGYRVTGPNGNSIFLPFGGRKSNDNHYNLGRVGFYWVSTLSDSQYAPAVYLHSERDYMNYARYMAQSIRPVLIKAEEMDDSRMDDIIPENMREGLKNHMPIFNGVNPPNIEGAFLIEPYTTVYCEDGCYDVGRVIDTYKIKFYNQNFINNTIDMYDYNTNNTNNYSIGKGAFISGNGDKFTAFFATEGYTNGIYNKMAVVISGRKTNQGIKNFYYGLLMVEKGDDPNKKLMDVGYFRVFKDGDSTSEPTTWDLSAGTRGENRTGGHNGCSTVNGVGN